MKTPIVTTSTLFAILCLQQPVISDPAGEGPDIMERDGIIHVLSYPIDARWLNAVDPAYETEFNERANRLIRRHAQPGRFGNKHFENEKSSYPNAFMAFLAGHREAALGFLSAEDTQSGSWHTHTEGIDYYAAFTLT